MLSQHALRQMRNYSTRLPNDPASRLKGWAVSGYVVGAFTLPFVPPYLATQTAKKNGTFQTRPAIKWSCPCI